MLFLSYFSSFCTRKYKNVSCWSSLKFRLFCPLPIVRLLKVLNVACGKCGKSGKMRMRHIEPAFKQAQTWARGDSNKYSLSLEWASADNWTGQASSCLFQFDFRSYIFHDLAKNMQAYLCILSPFYCESVPKKRLRCSKICIFALFVVYSHPNLG